MNEDFKERLNNLIGLDSFLLKKSLKELFEATGVDYTNYICALKQKEREYQ